MTHLYFHCTGPGEVLVDRRGMAFSDLAEAREHAIAVARYFMESTFGFKGCTDWSIYVGDDENEEVLSVPFSDALPTLH